MADKESKRTSSYNPFYSIQFFVFCQGFLHFAQLMTSSYMKSSISTIERRFGLSSQMSGFIVSFNEVGNTILIIFVSYLGSRVHRPRLIGCGAILVSMSSFIISLPHFITDPYEYDRSVSAGSNSTDICLPNKVLEDETCSAKEAKEISVVLFLIFLGQLLMGIGAVPIQPFGISYIDDFASKTNSPLYLGILFAATTLGPAVAFLLGAITLRFFVDINRIPLDEIGITHKDPRWVGAWWLGFLISASLVAIASIPYFFFPRTLTKQEDLQKNTIIVETVTKDDYVEDMHAKAHEQQDLTLTQFLKMFPMALVRHMRNPIFVVVVLALINLSGMVAGLATFMAKFLERQFGLPASFANMLLGSVNIPAGMLGIVLGGAIIKNCKLSLRQASAMCIFSMGLCVLFDIPLLFMGCPTQNIAGLNASTGSSIQPTAECNKMCKCSPSAFNPVCGQDNIEYVSPCYAGCTVVNLTPNSNNVMNFSRCNCILVDKALGFAKPGSCGSQCSHFLVPFVALACVSGFVASIAHTPAFVMILRSVRPEDKSFAIGIQFLMIRIAAWLPAPVLYGSLIDTTCLLWLKRCDKRASCRYYDHTLFRQRFMTLQLVFEVSCLICFCIVYLLFWRKEKQALELEVIPESQSGDAAESKA